MKRFIQGSLIYKILFAVFGVLYAVIQVGTVIALENASVINRALNVQDYKWEETGEEQDSEYFTSRYGDLATLSQDGEALAERVEAEGAALLKNENGALPLAKGNNVSLFSYSTVDPAFGGSGSASSDNPKPAVSMKEGLTEAGLNVNASLWNWYAARSKEYKSEKYRINDAPWSDVSSANSSSFSQYGDAAVFNVKRCRGENSDPSLSDPNCDGEGGNYLALNDNEKSVLQGLAALKGSKFRKIVVLLNTPNQVEAAFLNDPQYKIDAVLWIGSVGQTGMRALGKLLVGDDNPCGRLSDTFWNDHEDNPAMANFGNMRYANYNSYRSQLPAEADNSYTVMAYGSYVAYQEGIYVGYRYTETRYEDVVMNRAQTGDFHYDQVVAYPFGFGLSYTQFDYSDFDLSYNGNKDVYTLRTTVRNTGGTAGREVVQIYLQKPYTAYDIEHGIEKAAVELVGFGKTSLLQAGASENVKIEIDGRQLASYDADGAETYVIDAGEYFFTVGKNSHHAVNNILKSKGYAVDGNAELTKKIEKSFDAQSYSQAENGTKIQNLFENADWNKYANNGGTGLNYVSRSDWSGTLPSSVGDRAVLNMNQAMVQELLSLTNSDGIAPDDGEYPQYEAENGLTLVDLRVDSPGERIPYGDESWDELLDNLSWKETCLLISEGMRSTAGASTVVKPPTVEHNGPNGITEKYSFGERGLATIYGDPDADYSPTYYPCINILASTFDRELAEEVGKAYGEDALWAGYSGLYGIGVNIHRTAFDGRSFEYYSEDGYLSGALSAKVVVGLQSKGCNAYVKHLAVYEQQANRVGLSVWVNEQTLREIYLKPFEMAIREGKAMNLMTAYTRLGVVYCPADAPLLQGFIRGECGMEGLIVSDMWTGRYKNEQLPLFLMAGCDLPDGNLNAYGIYESYRSGYSAVGWRMREAAKRILYATVHSNAMNGISSSSVMVRVVPLWQTLLYAGTAATGTVGGAAFVACLTVGIYNEKRKAKTAVKAANT